MCTSTFHPFENLLGVITTVLGMSPTPPAPMVVGIPCLLRNFSSSLCRMVRIKPFLWREYFHFRVCLVWIAEFQPNSSSRNSFVDHTTTFIEPCPFPESRKCSFESHSVRTWQVYAKLVNLTNFTLCNWRMERILWK